MENTILDSMLESMLIKFGNFLLEDAENRDERVIKGVTHADIANFRLSL